MAELRVLSWNVFFDTVAQPSRYRAILDTCRHSGAHVMCFQEVTLPFVQQLQRQDWVHRDYECSDDFSGSSVAPYGVCTLALRRLTPSFIFHTLPTRMSRRLLLTRLSLPSASPSSVPTTALLGNVHLESLASHPTRVRQLHACHAALTEAAQAAASAASPCTLSLLVGDFNFCSYRNFVPSLPLENDDLAACMPGWVDVWPLLKDTEREKGYTFDTCANGMIEALGTSRVEQMRYDRVMARFHGPGAGGSGSSSGNSWAAEDIQMVGTTQLTATEQGEGQRHQGQGAAGGSSSTKGGASRASPKDRLSIDTECDPACIYPSDHFGLVATFKQGPDGRG